MIINFQKFLTILFLLILLLLLNNNIYSQNYWDLKKFSTDIYNTNSGDVDVYTNLSVTGTIYTNTISGHDGNTQLTGNLNVTGTFKTDNISAINNSICFLNPVGIGAPNNNTGLYITGYSSIPIKMYAGSGTFSRILEVDANGYNFIQMSGGDNGNFAFLGQDLGNTLMQINNNGWIGIGTTTYDPNHLLSVHGSIRAQEIKVESGWSDFVFNTNYRLRTLIEVEKYINENNHLPDMPSEQEVKENGVDLGDMSAKLTQKVEELTLYIIELNKKIDKLEKENDKMKEKINNLNK